MNNRKSSPSRAAGTQWQLALLALLATAVLFACTPASHDPGLLQAAEFGGPDGRLVRPWSFTEHAGGESYVLEIAGGVATIRRIGREPWARLAQPVATEMLATLVGRTLAFSVEVRTIPEPGGPNWPEQANLIAAQAWGRPAAGNSRALARLGPKLIMSERLELDPADGTDWQRHTIEFRLPKNATRLEVSATMRASGRMELRNPALVVTGD